METNEKLLKCKSSTDANRLAGSIWSAYQEDHNVRLSIRVIGAGSLNQAIKAAIVSNKYFSKVGIVIDLRPSFNEVGDNVTAIELKVIFTKN